MGASGAHHWFLGGLHVSAAVGRAGGLVRTRLMWRVCDRFAARFGGSAQRAGTADLRRSLPGTVDHPCLTYYVDHCHVGTVMVDCLPALHRDRRVVLEIEGHQSSILVLFVRRRLYAIDNRCPHRTRRLEDATVRGRDLICPGHGLRFKLAGRDGRAYRPQEARLRHYPVWCEDGRLHLCLYPQPFRRHSA
ncbi:Rieske 2Fe-2S domain-containing protein [Nocardia sp. NPDC004860]|uniref:Rieske (2Fe-2S) protein n=1 Tax=Nocardia sp. NPDC004860 TaxID=3154557 RepID=UPI0033BDF1E7